MDLAAVGGHRTARLGASAVAGDQHDALRRRGDAPTAKQIERGPGGPVEDGEIVRRPRCHAHDVADRYHRAPTGDADAGATLQILQRGADDDAGRQPVVLAQLTAFQHTAPDRDECIVPSLRHTAVVTVDLGLGRRSRDAGALIVGIAHPGRPELREDRLVDGPRLGGQGGLELGHAIGPLRRLGHAAAPRAFGVVGCGAVLIQEEQPSVGVVLELLGADAHRSPDQIGLELTAGGDVDRRRDAFDRLAQHSHVLAVDHSVGLGDGRTFQEWLQRFAVQRLAGPQLGGVLEPAAGLGGRDPPPDRQHVTPGLGAHRPWRGLGLQAGQQPVALHRELAGEGLEVVEHPDEFGPGERVDGQRCQPVVGRTQRRDRLTNLLHYSNLCSNPKNSAAQFTRIL